MSAVETVFRSVVDASWRSSCLIGVVLGLRVLLRKRLSARVLFWVWIAVAVRLLVPFTAEVSWSPYNLLARGQPGAAAAVVPVASGNGGSYAMAAKGREGLKPAARSGGWQRQSQNLRLGPGLAWTWLAGIVALSLARILAWARFARRLRRSRTEPSPAVLALVAAAGRVGGRRLRVSVTDAVGTPALQGIFRPNLLFPSGFLEKLTPREIQLTVAHELAHDRRGDLLAQALIRSALFLHWFNPLVWFVARTARDDCELACDESVIRELDPAEPTAYGATLLKILSLASGQPAPPWGLGVVESKRQIKRRIEMIVAPQTSTLARTLLGCALFFLITGLSLTSETRAKATATPGGSAAAALSPAPWAPAAADPRADAAALDAKLKAFFSDGIVATIGQKEITVDELRREMLPLLPQLRRVAHSPDEFSQKLDQLQNQVVALLVSRVLLIKEFRTPVAGGEAKHIPDKFVDNRIADMVANQYDGDQAKLVAYVQSRGETMGDFRKEVEEDIIFNYMQQQQRKLAHAEEQVHLRLIQLSRSPGDTDAALLARANAILVRFRNGEKFEDLAKAFDEDSRAKFGGDWGWKNRAALRPEYGEPLFALKPGEVTAPILGKAGCFLLYAEDRRSASVNR